MKFLLVTSEYFPFKGGVANYYTNMVYHWPSSSDITVLDNSHNKLIRKKGLLKWWPSLFSVYRQIKSHKIENVLVGQILPIGTVVFLLSFLLDFKYSVFFHGMDLSLAKRNAWKRFLSKKIINRADKIICANSAVLKMVEKFYVNNEKNILVNPGVGDFNFKNEEKKQQLIKQYNLKGKRILFSLGRLVKRKGFDYGILAFKKTLKMDSFDNLVYIISGEGPDEKYLKDLAREEFGNDWNKKIIFTGNISEEEKWTFLSLSDIFIMPARNISGDFEGFGIVYLEANLALKPVIAGNSGGVADAVSDSYNGFLVDPENEEEISQVIFKLLKNDELRLKIGKQGRERALKDFDWKNQVAKIYQFLIK